MVGEQCSTKTIRMLGGTEVNEMIGSNALLFV